MAAPAPAPCPARNGTYPCHRPADHPGEHRSVTLSAGVPHVLAWHPGARDKWRRLWP